MPGSGVCERQPALLVPGYTGSKEDFLTVLWPLAAAGRRVVAIDMRGQYETPGSGDQCAYGPDALAADIAEIAAAVGPDGRGVHLLGHSLGGLIARQAVLARRAGLSSLTLLGSGPGSLRGQRATVLRAMLAELAKAGPGRRAARVRELWESELEPQAVADGVPAPVVAFLRERMLRNSVDGLIAMGKYLLACPDQSAELASLGSAPILVLYGENDDAWTPAVQDRMARRLGAQRILHPRCRALPRCRGAGDHGKHANRVLERGREQRTAPQGRRSRRSAAGRGLATRELTRRGLAQRGLAQRGLAQRGLGRRGLAG